VAPMWPTVRAMSAASEAGRALQDGIWAMVAWVAGTRRSLRAGNGIAPPLRVLHRRAVERSSAGSKDMTFFGDRSQRAPHDGAIARFARQASSPLGLPHRGLRLCAGWLVRMGASRTFQPQRWPPRRVDGGRSEPRHCCSSSRTTSACSGHPPTAPKAKRSHPVSRKLLGGLCSKLEAELAVGTMKNADGDRFCG
jgi:hypothetical protein